VPGRADPKQSAAHLHLDSNRVEGIAAASVFHSDAGGQLACEMAIGRTVRIRLRRKAAVAALRLFLDRKRRKALAEDRWLGQIGRFSKSSSTTILSANSPWGPEA
jgi:hypothetical protein